MSGTRTARFVTIPAEYRSADLWLERNLIVLAAVIANYLKSLWCIFAKRRLFRAAIRTPLWRRHVTLIKDLLVLFSKDKDLFALNTWYFCIRHNIASFPSGFMALAKSLPQIISGLTLRHGF
jgi:hypothetical protein